MIHNEPCVNGILAAVLSASVIPLHGALAKEKSPRLQKAMGKPVKTNVAPPGVAPVAPARRVMTSAAQ